MTKNINDIVKRIAKLNDTFRASILRKDSEQIYYTPCIMALPIEDILSIKEKVKLFDDFNESNDPFGEHDFGSFTHKTNKVYWKIDYDNPDLEYLSKSVPFLNERNRKLTIMLSHEW